MTCLLGAAGCLLVVACGSPAGGSGVLLHHGKIFTADTARPWAEAVLVRGERIVAVGPNDSVMALADGATAIDLEGATVVPGFNDAHVHLYPGPPPVTVVADPNPTADPDLALVLDSLRAAVARTPAGTRLSVSVGERILSDPRARRAALDAVAPEHRVELVAWSGHGLVLNSAALAAARVTDDAPDPVGGRYERNARGLTGLMEEYAGFRAYAQLADTSDAAVREALTAYAAEVLPLGTTSIQIMATAMTPEAIGRLGSDFSLPLETRIIRFPLTTADHRERDRWRALAGTRGPSLRISGTKYVLDGTPVERLAVLRGTYADRRGWYGRLDFPPDTVRAILAEAVAGGEQPLLHAVGDSTVALVLRLMADVAPDSVWRRLRPRIEHGEGLMPDLFESARRMGVVLVQNPTHLGLGPMVPARIGAGERLATYQPLRSALAAGIPLAFGSDGPLNPFLNLMLAVIHPDNPAEALTMEQAVRAYTAGSAWAEFREDEKGTLAPGKLADLAVLSQDIFSVPPPALMATVSTLTLRAGRPVHDPAGRLSGMTGRATP